MFLGRPSLLLLAFFFLSSFAYGQSFQEYVSARERMKGRIIMPTDCRSGVAFLDSSEVLLIFQFSLA